MKGSTLYMIFLFAFLILVFLFEYMSPHKFIWVPTYDKYDKEPFGSFVFDDIMSSSINDYSVINKTFYQIIQDDSTITQHAFLLTEAELPFNAVDVENLYKLIHLGNKVMICTEAFPSSLKDTLYFETKYGGRFPSLDVYVQKENTRGDIFFGTDSLNPEHTYSVFPHIHPIKLTVGKNISIQKDTCRIDEGESDNESVSNDVNRKFFPVNCDSMEIIVWDSEHNPLVIHAFIGKGEIFIVSTPLMFTNYGMLDGDNASYTFRLLSYMKDRPLIRVEAYGKHSDKPNSPLRYLLSEPPLRWAVYFAMILLILFMAFTAKRRQRIIPVVNTPPNKSLEFMQLISNLYYQKHNNAEILKMKHIFLCAEIKANIGIDLQENIPDEQDYKRLVEKTGIEADNIRALLKNIQMALYRVEVDDKQLKQYIDGMNKILKALKVKS